MNDFFPLLQLNHIHVLTTKTVLIKQYILNFSMASSGVGLNQCEIAVNLSHLSMPQNIVSDGDIYDILNFQKFSAHAQKVQYQHIYKQLPPVFIVSMYVQWLSFQCYFFLQKHTPDCIHKQYRSFSTLWHLATDLSPDDDSHYKTYFR